MIICASKNIILNVKEPFIELKYFSLSLFDRYVCFLRNYGNLIKRIKKFWFFKNKFENFLKKNNVDLVYFSGPSQYSLYLEETKFFISIPDVDHREYLEFPEAVDAGEFQRKDEIFSKSLIRAQSIITNSEIIKTRLINYYNLSPNRIYIINLRPAISVENFSLKKINYDFNNSIIKKYNLPNNYVFCPAMYLPHKNHKVIIDAVENINNENNNEKKIKIVFSGSDSGNKKYKKALKEYCLKKNLLNDIYFLDFVTDDELPYLYLNSQMLVFPALMGPTFIPPLEAFKIGKPVIFAKSENIESVYGDAVKYVDPMDHIELKNAINEILTDKNLANKLINNGFKKIKKIQESDDFNLFFHIINNFRKIQSTWRLDN